MAENELVSEYEDELVFKMKTNSWLKNRLFCKIFATNYNIFSDGCFWIIGRIGLQALKCVNDLFDVFGDIKINSCEFFLALQGNSHESNYCHKDKITLEKTKLSRSLELDA
ncbi:hypothetical protein C1646_666249 [Rhizophagus diaphanus]|nr:hypothetical protein C1646_666249 [Rhizophagus diaphanus] [Rhizophagus sp. MUCL 43196]